MFGAEDITNQHLQFQNRSSNGSDQSLFELEHIDFSELFEDVEYKQLARQSIKTCGMDSSIIQECSVFCFFARLLLIMQQSIDDSRYLRNWGILDNVLDYIIIERTVLAGLLIVMKASNSKVSFYNALYRLHRILLGIDDLQYRIFIQSKQLAISKDIRCKHIPDKGNKPQIIQNPQELRIELADLSQSQQQSTKSKKIVSPSFLSSPSAPVSPQYSASEKEFLLVTYEIFYYAQKYARQFLSNLEEEQEKQEISKQFSDKKTQEKIQNQNNLSNHKNNSNNKGASLRQQPSKITDNRLSSSSSSSSSENQEQEEEQKKMRQICELAEIFLKQQDSSYQPRKKISSLDLSYSVQDTLVSFRKKLSDSLRQSYIGLKPNSLGLSNSSSSSSISSYSLQSPLFTNMQSTGDTNHSIKSYLLHSIPQQLSFSQQPEYLSIYSPTSPELNGITFRSNSIDRELSLVSVNYLASLEQVQDEQQEQVKNYLKGLLHPRKLSANIMRDNQLGNGTLNIRKSIQSPSNQESESLITSSGQEKKTQFLQVIPLSSGIENDNDLEGSQTQNSSSRNNNKDVEDEEKQTKLNMIKIIGIDQIENDADGGGDSPENFQKKKKYPSALKIQKHKGLKQNRNYKVRSNKLRQFQRKRIPDSYKVSIMQEVIEEKEDSDLFNSMLLERTHSQRLSSKISQGDEQQKQSHLGTSQTFITSKIATSSSSSPSRMRSSYFSSSQSSNPSPQMQISLKLRSQSIDMLEDEQKNIDGGKIFDQVERVEEGKDEDADEEEEKKVQQINSSKIRSEELNNGNQIQFFIGKQQSQRNTNNDNKNVLIQKSFETTDDENEDEENKNSSDSSSDSQSESSSNSSSSSESVSSQDKNRSNSNGSENSASSGGTVWSIQRRNGIQIKTVQKHISKRGKEFDTVGVVAPNYALVSQHLREQEELIKLQNKKNRRNHIGNSSLVSDSEDGNINTDVSSIFNSSSLKHSQQYLVNQNLQPNGKFRKNRITSIKKKNRKSTTRSSFISKIVSFFHQEQEQSQQTLESASESEEGKFDAASSIDERQKKCISNVVPLNGICFYRIKDVNNLEQAKDQQQSQQLSYQSNNPSFNTHTNIYVNPNSLNSTQQLPRNEYQSSKDQLTDDDEDRHIESPDYYQMEKATQKSIKIHIPQKQEVQDNTDDIANSEFEAELKLLFKKSSPQPDYDLQDRKNGLLNIYGKLSQIRETAKLSSLNYKELSLVVDEAGAYRQNNKKQLQHKFTKEKEVNEEQFFDFPRESVNMLEYLKDQREQTKKVRIAAQKYTYEYQILTRQFNSKWIPLRLAVQKMIYEKKFPNEKYALSLGEKNKQNNNINRHVDSRPYFSSSQQKSLIQTQSCEDDFCFDLSETAGDTNNSFISSSRAKLQEQNKSFRSISSQFDPFFSINNLN